ncbi:MAG: hypothetical protein J5I47_07925 [Vicingus serpentipes]|nr:hypothetical protein [Vicingus serpentipes]
MVLWLSLIVLLIGIILILFTDEVGGLGLTLVILSLAGGFLVLGNLIPVKEETIRVPVKIYCSTEVGECRVITQDEGSYTFTDYSKVKALSENPPDSIHIRYHYNSYGGKVSQEITL